MMMKNFTVGGRFKTLFLMIILALWVVGCGDDFSQLEQEKNALQETETHIKNATIVDNTISGEHVSGGYWQISLPEDWNSRDVRNLIVYAHGYVDVVDPVQLPNDEIDGIPLKDLVNGLGWGYAATSYRANGLVIKEAILDLIDLREIVDEYLDGTHGFLPPDFVFLGGVSEGGLIGTLTVEQYPDLFHGALITCCPIGDFYKQLQYFGDFHVLFNYFFKAELMALGIDLGNPMGVPESTMVAWKTGTLQPLIIGILSQNPGKVMKLLKTARVPVDESDPQAVGMAILELLRFNIMATNDAIARLGGCPYNNLMPKRWYFGSGNDLLLNRTIERIKCDSWAAAKAEVDAFYQTSGDLHHPVVILHTVGDHVSPYWHQILYFGKVLRNRDFALYVHQPINRYGHCNFTQEEIVFALTTLVYKVSMEGMFSPAVAVKAP